MIDFFIQRPVFASVIAIIIVLAGGVAILLLPVAQFPPITPPTIQVSAFYPGASAEVVERTVTTPLEEQINGVEGMLYMSSRSSNGGSMGITITFDVGYDLNIAGQDVQNRAQNALAQLPAEVVQQGVSVSKQSTDFTLAVNLTSPDGRYDDLFLSNYADLHISDVLRRIPGIGQVFIYGARTYAMRLWLDPDKLASLGLTAMDVINAVVEQNTQVAAGAIGQPPVRRGQSFQFTITTQGRLTEPSEFEAIILRTRSDGSIVRMKDIARVELGAQDYGSFVRLNGRDTAFIAIFTLPGGNALDVARQVKAQMERLAKHFPEGMAYTIVYDTTRFVRQSISEVLLTLVEAILLVLLVVFVFLQDWRATLIPAITIPVSLIGTFVMLKVLGFSINLLTLFGLVLATGLVVDDAIIVVENVSRFIVDQGRRTRQAVQAAMHEVVGPIIATSLVLMAVFVPVAFMPGVSGQLYRQFALTIACSVGISAINALTLSPALCAIFLRAGNRLEGRFSRLFNRAFDGAGRAYGHTVRWLIQGWMVVLIVFVALLALTYYMFRLVPTGFIPDEDQGYFVVNIQGPDGSSLERTRRVVDQVEAMVRSTPGVADIITSAGGAAPNTAQVFVVLQPWEQRKAPELQLEAIIGAVRRQVASISEAIVVAFNPPAIPGLGAAGGFQFELQDIAGLGLPSLAEQAQRLVREGSQRPELAGLFNSFSADIPQLYIDLDRTKAKMLGIPISDIFLTLQTYLGSLPVNDFNMFGRVYRVYLQATEDFRSAPEDISRLYVRTSGGDMVPLSALIQVRPVVGPQDITHYNLYRSAEIVGSAAPGVSSGEAIEAMERLAAETLPEGMGYEWTGIAYQELQSGHQAPLLFALALVVVFLFLAAQYESWSMPFIVLLAVPLALLGALTAQWLRGLANDVYCQIGLLMLIGLASKNAILIVEFARRRRDEGLSIQEAALEAARIRLRPILMTAFAFILGVVPLVLASGAGANSRHSLGTAVFGGMIFSTFLSLAIVPVLYVLIERLRERQPQDGEVKAAVVELADAGNTHPERHKPR
ncbi:MAG TPA: multidrug efflux RND transporter permease subunit [Alphaproteobacteria bacterium]|nr:multidrug efflux RND transporter permease subunit [Alphaproteobacteria bacterium]